MTTKTKKESNILSDSISATITHNLTDYETTKNVQQYVKSGFQNTYYLGYRDIPYFLEKYTSGKRAIDYGCGTGRSTRFLQANGFEAIGVDISKQMLKQALKLDKKSHYLHITTSCIPIFSESCDLAFTCFVLFTISSKQELLSIFQEVYRTLREGGTFIIVTGSEKLYSHDWLSYNTYYPQNKMLKSGDIAKIQLKDLGIELTNYYWMNQDYEGLFKLSNFKILERHFPMGKLTNEYPWISEAKHAPYVVYILQKN